MPDLDRLLAAIDAAESSALGADSDGDLSEERSKLIEQYLGVNTNPAPEGRSNVVDRSVFETVQWILPSLCRIFANGDDVVEFVPLGPDDEEGAKQESAYLNFVVTQRNRWFDLFLTWATDALTTKNAYAYAFYDKRISTETEKYEDQTDEQLAMLAQDPAVEIVAHSERPDESQPPQPMIDPQSGQPVLDSQTGQPVMQPPRMLHTVEMRRKSELKRITIKILPPEHCKVASSTPSHTLEECPYFEFWEMKTISDLRSMGFDVEDDVGTDEESDTSEDDARDQFDVEDLGDDEGDIDPSTRKVKVRSIWLRYDYDEDGIAEMNYVVRVGRDVLYHESCPRIPVSSIVPATLPHRHMGISVAEMVADIQDIKTAILRQGLDSLYLANNPRMGVSPQVNLDDLLVSRPGGVVRVEGLPAEHMMPVVQPFVFPQALQGLEYMDQIRENRTGTNRYFTGIDQNALNKTASGISQLSSMAAQRVEQIARVFAQGVEQLFQIVHELILRHGHEAETVKLRGKWVTIDPRQWRKRTDMRMAVGYAAGNKDAMMEKLMLILQAQREAIQIGVATPKNIHEALIELTKAADFAAPERFWTDPGDTPPQPPQNPLAEAEKVKGEAQMQIKQTELQAEQQKVMAEQGFEQQKLAAELQLKKYEVDKRAEVDLTIAREKMAFEIDKTYLADDQQTRRDAMARDEEDRSEGEGGDVAEALETVAEALQVHTEQVSQMLTGVVSAMAQAMDGMTGPREVIRDQGGRVVGMKRSGGGNGASAPPANIDEAIAAISKAAQSLNNPRSVVRDKSGRVVGLQ